MAEPLIGITVSLDHGERLRAGHDYLYVKRAYAQAVARAGGRPVLVSPELAPAAAAEICDGLVISGGDDIPPELYGERAAAAMRRESRERIDWERQLLDLLTGTATPLLGVCYGMQLINVHFGGTLVQDIAGASPAALDHGGGGRATAHEISIAAGSFLAPLFGAAATVCSTHHQAVARVAPGFRVAATSPDGVIEAIERDHLLAVEWHPEADQTGEAVYRLLVERARQHRALRASGGR
ncbi:MAG TPA: gamma-glutamyl-gamma-aminobutyrate hydrolase family protein [Blastocatellia bacterium]|nr:gamma-glutamyl-gamma-aminobutyrate hydrolase family protein [Blastocatellia bacterium]